MSDYYLREKAIDYAETLKDKSKANVYEAFRPKNSFPVAYFLLFLAFFAIGLVTRTSAQVLFLVQYVSFLMYFAVVLFLHEHIHKFFLNHYGGVCQIHTFSRSKHACLETSRHQFTRNQYVISLLGPMLVSLLIAVAHILFTFLFTETVFVSAISYMLAFLSIQAMISTADIHDASTLMFRYSKNCSVTMILEYHPNSNRPYYGFIVDKDTPKSSVAVQSGINVTK